MSEQEQGQTGLSQINPYVGPRAFQRGETLYGRSYEQQHLLDLLIAERIVLLYSPSGAGKTSLIEAGLIRPLEDADFFVLPTVRVNPERLPSLPGDTGNANNGGSGPNRYVLSIILALEDQRPPELRREPATLINLTFNDYLNTYPRPAGAPDNMVLILDQFEEVLTVDAANVAAKTAFFAQLGVALRNRSRWLLCSMREDYVAALDPYLRLVPTRLSTTFRLDVLGVAGATEAAMQPSVDAGRPFDEAVVKNLVDDLRRTQVQRLDGTLEEQLGPIIEPVHLQVVCRRLWEQVQAGDDVAGQHATTARSDVDAALADYYEREIDEIVRQMNVSERAIREWINDKLITEQGIRSQVLQGAEQSDGLDNRVVEALVDSHLVRSDKRPRATWFELAHDRLIRPIRKSNAAWAERNLNLLQRQTLLWVKQDRPKGMLLRDEALDKAEQWANDHASELTKFEQEFLAQCVQERTERKRENAYNWLQRVAIVLLLLLVVGLVVVVVNVVRQQRTARVQQLASYAREAPERFPQKSLLLALETHRLAQQYGVGQTAAAQSLHVTLAAIGGIPLVGHSDAVQAVAFRPGAQELATASADATVRLWQVDAPMHATAAMPGHVLGATTLAFSPNGQLLATAGGDPTVRLWQVDAPARPLAELAGHMLRVDALSFSPDGQLLATGDFSGTARLWRIATPPQLLASLESSAFGTPALAFSRDGTRFAVGAPDGSVQILSMAAPLEEATVLREVGASVTRLAFSPDGQRLLATAGGTILLWQLATPAAAPIVLGGTTEPSGAPLTTFAVSPDSTALATGSTNGTVLRWQLDALDSAPTVLGAHAQGVTALAFSPNGNYLASGSDDGNAWLWSMQLAGQGPTVLRGHEGAVRALAFSDDAAYLATASADGSTRLWPIGAPQREPTILRDHGASVQSVAFSDEATLITTSGAGSALRWNLAGRVAQSTTMSVENGGIYRTAISPDSQWVVTVGLPASGGAIGVAVDHVAAPAQRVVLDDDPSLAFPNVVLFSPNSRLVASGGSDGRAHIWQLNALQKKPVIVNGGVFGNVVVAFNLDGQLLATGNGDGTVHLWRTDMAAPPSATLRGHEQRVSALAFSPDGTTLASASDDGTTRLWNVASPTAAALVLANQGSNARVLAYSPDERTLAVGYADGTVWLWNTAAPKTAPIVLRGHTAAVASLAFSADAALLATGSADTTARLWQLTPRSVEPVILRGHQGSVGVLAISPNARYLASGSDDATVRVWSLQPADLVARACATVGRNLSAQELLGTEVIDSIDGRKTCDALPLHASVYGTLLAQDKVDTALAAYDADRLQDPTLDPPAAWLVRQAATLLEQGRLDQALALYTQASTIDAQLNQAPLPALNQLCLTGTSERFDEALDACNHAVALAPTDGDYRFNRGLIHRRAGKRAQAIQDFEAFIAIVSDQPNAGSNVPLAQQWIDELKQELGEIPTATP